MNTSNHSGRRWNRDISPTRDQGFITTPTRSMSRRHETENRIWNLHRPEYLSPSEQVSDEIRKHRILNM